ncbi:MAG: hypothetical protein J6P13_03995 [Kiritimatiellae bacterium]|nr:hypothetical protein [Kiritimatiellia bacterium]
MASKVTGAQVSQTSFKVEDFRTAVNYENKTNKGYVRFVPDGNGGVKLAKVNNKIDLFINWRTNIDAEKNRAMREKFVDSLTRDLKWADRTSVENIADKILRVKSGDKKGEGRTDALSRKELQSAFAEYDKLMNSTGGRQKMINNLLMKTAERCGLVANEQAVRELKHRFFPSNENWREYMSLQDCNPDIPLGEPGHMKVDEATFKAKLHALELKCEDAVKRASIENVIRAQAEGVLAPNAVNNDFGLNLSIENKAQLRGALLHFLAEKGLAPTDNVNGTIGTGGMIFEAFIDKVLPELYKKCVADIQAQGETGDKQLAMEAFFSFDAIMEEAEKFIIGARDYIANPPADAVKLTGNDKIDGIIKNGAQTVKKARNMAKSGYIMTAAEHIAKNSNISQAEANEIAGEFAKGAGAFQSEGLLKTFTQKFLAERGVGEDVKPGDEQDQILTNTLNSILETGVKVGIAAQIQHGNAKIDPEIGLKVPVDNGMGGYVKEMEDAIGEIASGKNGLDKVLMGKLFSCTLANIASRKVESVANGMRKTVALDKNSEETDKALLKATAESYVKFEQTVLKTINGAKTAFEKLAKAVNKKGLLYEGTFNDLLQRASTKFANAHKAALHEFFLKSPVESAEDGEKILARIFKAKLSEARAELDNDLAIASLARTFGAANQRKLLAVEERVSDALAQNGLDAVKVGREGLVSEKTARAHLAAGELKRLYTATLAAHLKSVKTVDGYKTVTDDFVKKVVDDFNAKAVKLLKSVAESETKFLKAYEEQLNETISNIIENEGGDLKGYVTGAYPVTKDEKKALVKDLTAEVMRYKASDLKKNIDEILDAPSSFAKKDVKLVAKTLVSDHDTGAVESTIMGLTIIIKERKQMIADYLAGDATSGLSDRVAATGVFGKGGAMESATALEKSVFTDKAVKDVKARMNALPAVYATGDKAALEARIIAEASKIADAAVKPWVKFRTSFIAKAAEIEKEFSAMGADEVVGLRGWVLMELAQKALDAGDKGIDLNTALGYYRNQLESTLNYAIGQSKTSFEEYSAKVEKVLAPAKEKIRAAVEDSIESTLEDLSAEGQAYLKDEILPKIYREVEFDIYRNPDAYTEDKLGARIQKLENNFMTPLFLAASFNKANDEESLKNLIKVAGAGVLLTDKEETAAAIANLKTWLTTKEGSAAHVAMEKALLDYVAEVGNSGIDGVDVSTFAPTVPGNAVAGFRFAARDVLKMHTAQMLYEPFDNSRVGEAKDVFERWVDSHGLSRYEDFRNTTAKDRIMQKFVERVKSLQENALEGAENEPILTPSFIDAIDHVIDSDGMTAMLGEWKEKALNELKGHYLKQNDDLGYMINPGHEKFKTLSANLQENAKRNSEEILAVLSAKISEVAGSLDALGGLAAMKDAIAKIDMNAIIREVNDTVNVVVDECVRRFSLEESSVKLVMDYSHTFERQLVKDAIGEEAAKNFPNGFDDLLRFPKVVGDEKVVAAIGKARTYIAAYLNEAFKYCNDKSTTTFTLETTFRKSTVACIAEVKKNKAIWKNGLEAALKAAAKELK